MKSKNHQFWLYRWGPALVIMGIIFILSATPSNELPNFGGSDTLIKKGAHMLGYGLLTLAYMRGFEGTYQKKLPIWEYVLLSLGISALYAMTDEYHQSFVLGRNSRWTDVGIDTMGSSIAIIVLNLFPAIRKATMYPLPSPRDEIEKAV